ncbi:hypothetical protein ACFHYO_04570 [Paracoccus panacisoli]|uniref:Uncharacterized protein n=2 Tax=Paracoccus TaxID=265 RepID=A0ABV6T2B6_9RHOB|nr:hypothetical protein [Paracoccus sanguinis]
MDTDRRLIGRSGGRGLDDLCAALSGRRSFPVVVSFPLRIVANCAGLRLPAGHLPHRVSRIPRSVLALSLAIVAVDAVASGTVHAETATASPPAVIAPGLTPAVQVSPLQSPATPETLLSAEAQRFIDDATNRLIAGDELPRDYPITLKSLPPADRLLVIVHLRRMGFLTTVEMPIDWVMDPAVPPSAQPAAVPQATAPKSETTR